MRLELIESKLVEKEEMGKAAPQADKDDSLKGSPALRMQFHDFVNP